MVLIILVVYEQYGTFATVSERAPVSLDIRTGPAMLPQTLESLADFPLQATLTVF